MPAVVGNVEVYMGPQRIGKTRPLRSRGALGKVGFGAESERVRRKGWGR